MKLLNKERIFLEDLDVLIERNEIIYLDMVNTQYGVSDDIAIQIIKDHVNKPFWIGGYNGGMRIARFISFNFAERYKGSLHNEDAEVFIPEPYQQYNFTSRYNKVEHQSVLDYWKTKEDNKPNEIKLTLWEKIKRLFI